MFEDCLPAPKKNGRSPFDKAAGVLVSLLVHFLLGLVVYYGRFTVKVISFEKEEVRSVVIAPPLTVTIPKIVGGGGVAAEGGPAGETARPPGARQEDAEPEPAVKGPPFEPGPLPAQAAAPAGTGSAIPSLSSKFEQEFANRTKPAGEPAISITLAPPGTPPGPPGTGGRAPLPDFSRYGRGAAGGGGVGGYGARGGRAGDRAGGRQRVGMSIPLKGYDLLPWASVVVDRIQRYWVLPPILELPPAAVFKLIVVINKSGELDSIEILEGTSVEVLDRAALEAVRGGLPFPPLPADFPGDLLEITFEFVYND